MELETTLLERRSVRFFTDQPVERQVLEELLEAAIWAPSAGNSQAWAFICITDPALVRKVCTITPGIFKPPPVLICVCSDSQKGIQTPGTNGEAMMVANCAMATQNVMLRAHDQGLASCVIGSFNITALRELLDLPAHIVPRMLLILGYPVHVPPAPARSTDVIHWEKYGQRSA